MLVKAKKKILYRGEVYECGAEIEMDECSAAIASKYGNIEAIGGAAETADEIETVTELPPLHKKK